jgi:hypothetical protein
MREIDESVQMVRWECHECEVVATCVLNDAARWAWSDHLEQHGTDARFSAWTWLVMPLPFGSDDA